jgi:hypothetical protein
LTLGRGKSGPLGHPANPYFIRVLEPGDSWNSLYTDSPIASRLLVPLFRGVFHQ